MTLNTVTENVLITIDGCMFDRVIATPEEVGRRLSPPLEPPELEPVIRDLFIAGYLQSDHAGGYVPSVRGDTYIQEMISRG